MRSFISFFSRAISRSNSLFSLNIFKLLDLFWCSTWLSWFFREMTVFSRYSFCLTTSFWVVVSASCSQSWSRKFSKHFGMKGWQNLRIYNRWGVWECDIIATFVVNNTPIPGRVIFMEDHIPIRPDRSILLSIDRPLHGLYGVWSSMKINLPLPEN